MSSQSIDYLSAIKNLDEEFQSYMIMALILIVLIIFICYMIYLNKLKSRECDYMNSLYPSVDGYIKPISANDPDCSGNLYDYYIKTAFNACSGGSYKNDFVDTCNLKAVIKQGVRCLDFEVYSLDNVPVVAVSTVDDFYVKETFNSVNFFDVMNVITNYAFSGGTCPNPTDPILIHLRIKSNKPELYTKMADIFFHFNNFMLGKDYSYEETGNNLGALPLLEFQNKIVLIVDRSNNTFLDNEKFLEYVNLTSNSVFMRCYDYYNIKNNPDTVELTEYNKRNITIVIPDSGPNPPNPSAILCRTYGCQMVAMRYQYVDNYLAENAIFFDEKNYAFALKPLALRYVPVTIETPTPQLEEYSYATRNASTDYYNFNF